MVNDPENTSTCLNIRDKQNANDVLTQDSIMISYFSIVVGDIYLCNCELLSSKMKQPRAYYQIPELLQMLEEQIMTVTDKILYSLWRELINT